MGGLEKPIYRGNCLKKGAWTVCRIKRGLDERKGVVVFEGWGVDTLMHTMSTFYGSSPNVTSNIKRSSSLLFSLKSSENLSFLMISGGVEVKFA